MKNPSRKVTPVFTLWVPKQALEKHSECGKGAVAKDKFYSLCFRKAGKTTLFPAPPPPPRQ